MKTTFSLDKSDVVNKLILVGNGFDLALGIESRYEDFLLWYFKKFIISSAKAENTRVDDNGVRYFYFQEDELFKSYSKSRTPRTAELIAFFEKEMKNYGSLKRLIKNPPLKFDFQFKSELLNKIFNDSITGWVDIENAYFELLKDSFKIGDKGIEKLNKDLRIIKSLLHEYLNGLDYSNSSKKDQVIPYLKHFTLEIPKNDLIERAEFPDETKMGKILFLNFNYTRTLSNVVDQLSVLFNENSINHPFDMEISQIHGNLDSEIDDLVFGYGDEMDADYKRIEELNDNRYFEEIKSFKYAENGKYRDLLRFVESSDYQVVIYGHSCGLSDRVMLNEIFEHENCKSIKIYYYDKQEFINKTMNISRHFKSNQSMRKKIVEFDASNQIPQLHKKI